MKKSSYQAYPEYRDSGVEWLGEVPRGWRLVPLKYLAAFSGGGTPSKDNPAYWDGDIPWVSPKDMKSRFIDQTIDNVTAKAVQRSSTNLLEEGALLLVVRSGILQHSIPAAINRVAVTLNQDMKALRFKEPMHVDFAQYFVIGNQRFLLLEWGKQGATVESLEQEHMGCFNTPCPPLPEQIQIAKFLDHETAKIDELIEKQQELIALLKEKRQAVISHAVTKGLNPNAPLKDSGIPWLGQIPEHWEITRLKNLVSLKHGYAFDGKDFVDSGSHILTTPGNFQQEGGFKLKASEKFFGGRCFPKDYLLKSGEIVVAMTEQGPGLLGCSAVIPDDNRFLHNQRIGLVKFEREDLISGNFLYHVFNSQSYRAKVFITSTGSKVKHTSSERMLTIAVPIPPLDEQEQIAAHIKATISQVEKLESHSYEAINLLRERRTALISAAVTGKIDVRHWQATTTHI